MMDDTLEPTATESVTTHELADDDAFDRPGVLEMVRPFDPISPDAEDEYDAVVRRVNRVRARRTRLAREFERMERPFVEDDLRVQTGPRRGQPLSPMGRKRRLQRLVEIGAELRQAEDEEAFAVAALDRMNRALDRWARETYGV